MRLLLFLLASALAAQAQDPGLAAPSVPPVEKKAGGLQFQLLPKSFSANPQVEMTVFSELTEYGRTLPEASPERPVYYVAQSQGFKAMGYGPGGDHPPAQDQIDRLVYQALAARGYLASPDSTHRPTLALFYFWGSHTGIDLAEAMDKPELQTLRQQHILQRAALVGGHAYVDKLRDEAALGADFMVRTPKSEHLRYQIEHDLYYVVVSAYDYASLTQKERKLAWRTTLTVNDQGVSMTESLPPLIASATDFFGRDTRESVALERRIQRGSVTLGPLIFIEDKPPAPVPAETK